MGKSFRRLKWLPRTSNEAAYYSVMLRKTEDALNQFRQKHYELSLKVREASLSRNRTLHEELVEELIHTEKTVWRMSVLRDSTAALLVSLSKNKSSTPPQLGERLLLLILSKEERINIPGDLEEEFRGIAAKHGASYAKLWYYKQVAASAWPMIRKAVRWGALAYIGEWVRRLI